MILKAMKKLLRWVCNKFRFCEFLLYSNNLKISV